MRVIRKSVILYCIVGSILSISGCSSFSDLPSCESSEVKDIVIELVGANYINGSACVVVSDDKFNIYNSVTAVSDASECEEGVVRIESEDEEKRFNIIPQAYRLNRAPFNIKAVYVDDMVTDFSKYVVRSQEKSGDKLSVSCSFSLHAERKSEKANWSDSLNIRNLSLTLFKKDDKGNRPYEYRWN